jgi:hypothetical protein
MAALASDRAVRAYQRCRHSLLLHRRPARTSTAARGLTYCRSAPAAALTTARTTVHVPRQFPDVLFGVEQTARRAAAGVVASGRSAGNVCEVLGTLMRLPAAAPAAVVAWRTAREDRMLLADFAGYAKFAARVRYRLGGVVAQLTGAVVGRKQSAPDRTRASVARDGRGRLRIMPSCAVPRPMSLFS